MTQILTIAQHSQLEFGKLFDKLARKCKRLKINPSPSFRILEDTKREAIKTRHVKSEGDVYTHRYSVDIVDVEIVVPQPVMVEGWEPFAILERNENGTLEPICEGHQNLKDARATIASGDMVCHHCNTKRTRNTTFLFRECSTGAVKQIGRECAKDYGVDASSLVAELEFQYVICQLSEEGGEDGYWGGGGCRMNRIHDMELFLQLIAVDQVKLNRPFQKTRLWDEYEQRFVTNPSSTRNSLFRMLNEYMFLEEKPCEQALAKARDMVEWFRQLPEDKLSESDYLASLYDLFQGDFISEKRLGIFASSWNAYASAKAKEEAIVPTTPAPQGKVIVRGKIASTKLHENDFGSVWKMLVVLNDGNKVWCSIPQGCKGDRGEEVEFKATFQRSDRDEHFAFGSRPSTKINAKDRKTLPCIG